MAPTANLNPAHGNLLEWRSDDRLRPDSRAAGDALTADQKSQVRVALTIWDEMNPPDHMNRERLLRFENGKFRDRRWRRRKLVRMLIHAAKNSVSREMIG